jgi:hypothetical protein
MHNGKGQRAIYMIKNRKKIQKVEIEKEKQNEI